MLREYWERLITSSAAGQWTVLIVGGSAVAMVLALLVLVTSIAVSGGTVEEASAPREKSAQTHEQRDPANEQTAKEQPAGEQAAEGQKLKEKATKPPPEPHTPQVRILWILKKKYYESHSTTVEIAVLPSGCKMATINYKSPFIGSNLAYEPADYYEAVCADPELHSQICFIRMNAYGTQTDDYGNKHRVLLLRTSMTRETADKINWKARSGWPFSRLIRLLHPPGDDEKPDAPRKHEG